jgi:hypothetical protein
MNRGDRREPIFKNDNDRLLFLKTLGEACQKTDWQVHAWCLMSNHFHLRTAVEGRGSRVEGRGSRVEGRGLGFASLNLHQSADARAAVVKGNQIRCGCHYRVRA